MGIFDQAVAEVRQRRADQHMKSEKYKEALEGYLKALKYRIKSKEKFDPTEYYKKIGECYFKIKPKIDDHRIANLKKGAEYYIKAAEEDLKKGKHSDAGFCYDWAGNCYETLEDDKNAAIYNRKSGEMYEQGGNPFEASQSYTQAAERFEKIGKNEEAAECYTASAEIDLDVKDKAKASQNYKDAALCYEKLKKYGEAVDLYLKSAGLDEELGNYANAAETFTQIASCYERQEKPKEAIKQYLHAADIYAKEDVWDKAVKNYINAGKILEKEGNIVEAMEYYIKSAEIREKNNDMLGVGSALEYVGGSFEKLEKHAEAVKYYMEAADAYRRAEKPVQASGLYKKAIEIDLVQGELEEKNGNHDIAASYFLNAAYCYMQLKDHEKAAELYEINAQSKEKGGDTSGAEDAYRKAADAYSQTDNVQKTAYCSIKGKDYERAAEYHNIIAQEHEAKKDYYNAGETYKTCMWCCMKLEKGKEMRDLANKMVWEYQTFLDQDKEKDTGKWVEAEKGIGEGYIIMDLPKKSVKYLEDALNHCREISDKNLTNIVGAQLSMVLAQTSIKESDFSKALKRLKESIASYGKINKENLGGFYREFLDGRECKAKALVADLESKPEVELTCEQPDAFITGKTYKIKAAVANNGAQPVEKVAFRTNLPQEFEIMGSPRNIQEIGTGEKRELEIEVKPTATGEYELMPLEVLYHDQQNKKYMKSSNKITLVVLGKGEDAYAGRGKGSTKTAVKLKILAEFGEVETDSIVILSFKPENHSDAVTALLDVYVNQKKASGVYVAVSKPYESIIGFMKKESIPEDKVAFVDCISKMAGKTYDASDRVTYVETPTALEEIKMTITNMMQKIESENKFVILDSLSSLLIYNKEKSVEELSHLLIGRLRAEGFGGVILATEGPGVSDVVRTLTVSADKKIGI